MNADEHALDRDCQGAHLGVDVGDFFDRTPLARSPVSRSNDATIGALTELLDELILGIDDEGRVERVETMSRLHHDGRG